MKEQSEKILHRKVCNHLQTFYPNVYFDSDPSGIYATMNTAKYLKMTRSRHAHLDIFIAEPMREFKGLFIELKKDTPYKLNGGLRTDQHLQEQHDTMLILESKGFKCQFSWSLDQAILILENYLGKPVIDNEPLF